MQGPFKSAPLAPLSTFAVNDHPRGTPEVIEKVPVASLKRSSDLPEGPLLHVAR
jgi:hypothetical protein